MKVINYINYYIMMIGVDMNKKNELYIYVLD